MTKAEISKIAAAVAQELRAAPPMALKEYLTLEEASQYTGLTKNALYKLTHSRQIPYSKPRGKLCFFRRTDLDDWMMSNPVDTEIDFNTKALIYCQKKNPIIKDKEI